MNSLNVWPFLPKHTGHFFNNCISRELLVAILAATTFRELRPRTPTKFISANTLMELGFLNDLFYYNQTFCLSYAKECLWHIAQGRICEVAQQCIKFGSATDLRGRWLAWHEKELRTAQPRILNAFNLIEGRYKNIRNLWSASQWKQQGHSFSLSLNHVSVFFKPVFCDDSLHLLSPNLRVGTMNRQHPQDITDAKTWQIRQSKMLSTGCAAYTYLFILSSFKMNAFNIFSNWECSL